MHTTYYVSAPRDPTPNSQVSNAEYRSVIKFLGPRVKTLKIRHYIPRSLFKPLATKKACHNNRAALKVPIAFLNSVRLNCVSLNTLEFKDCKLDVQDSFLLSFPKSLTALKFFNVQLENLPNIRTLVNSPFCKIKRTLPNLERVRRAPMFFDFLI